MSTSLRIREFDELQAYAPIFAEMKSFTKSRHDKTPDEIWFLQHQSVFTQGQAGKAEHILHPGDIPIVQSDRGGQVTYHGPGQLMIYLLFDLKRLNMGIKSFVNHLENSVIQLLQQHYQIEAHTKTGAPGVYVQGAKICSIGLRVSRHCTYHGLSFNVGMDLEPFSRINPCGYKNLSMTQLTQCIALKPCLPIQEPVTTLMSQVKKQFTAMLTKTLLNMPTVIQN